MCILIFGYFYENILFLHFIKLQDETRIITKEAKKMKKFISTIGWACIMTFVLLTACAPAERPTPSPVPSPNQTRIVRERMAPSPTPSPFPSPTAPGIGGNLSSRAEKIANEVAKMKEVDTATVVITGNTAMVGVQFDKQYKGEMTTKLKEMIDNRVKKVDKDIDNVAVTAEPDLFSRIKTLASDIENGKPLTGFVQEIQEILNRINPR